MACLPVGLLVWPRVIHSAETYSYVFNVGALHERGSALKADVSSSQLLLIPGTEKMFDKYSLT